MPTVRYLFFWANFLVLHRRLGAEQPCTKQHHVDCDACDICDCVGTAVNCYGKTLTEVPDGIHIGTETLNLENNGITTLRADTFQGLRNLKSINIFDNQLSYIHNDTFQPARSSLEHIWLYNNLINYIPVGLLRGHSRLRRLRLDKNYIEDIPDDLFADTASLTHLDLSSNLMREQIIEPDGTVEQQGFKQRGIFANCSNIEYLHMDNIYCPTAWPGDDYSTGLDASVSKAAGRSWRYHTGGELQNSVDKPCMWHLDSAHFCGIPPSAKIVVNSARFMRRCPDLSCSDNCELDDDLMEIRAVFKRPNPSTFIVACVVSIVSVGAIFSTMMLSSSNLKPPPMNS